MMPNERKIQSKEFKTKDSDGSADNSYDTGIGKVNISDPKVILNGNYFVASRNGTTYYSGKAVMGEFQSGKRVEICYNQHDKNYLMTISEGVFKGNKLKDGWQSEIRFADSNNETVFFIRTTCWFKDFKFTNKYKITEFGNFFLNKWAFNYDDNAYNTIYEDLQSGAISYFKSTKLKDKPSLDLTGIGVSLNQMLERVKQGSSLSTQINSSSTTSINSYRI